MVAYSFKKQFADPILAGTKGGTIRAERKGRGHHAHPGDQLQLYTGMRTRHCRLVLRTWCIGIADICLSFRGRENINAGGKVITGNRALDNFARLDGFADFEAMRAFWRETHDADQFVGVWIKWLRPASRVTMGSELSEPKAWAA